MQKEIEALKKYFIVTYGCQMNTHESEKIAGALEELDFEKANSEQDADIVVFNTCCIRENAERRAQGNIGALKPLKKDKPSLLIAVGGCMTQQDGAAVKLKQKFPFIDIVFGTHNLHRFKDLLQMRLNGKKKIVEIVDDTGKIEESESVVRSSYPNAWINIMRGCNNFCSYCIVPYVRGRERSRNADDVVKEAEKVIKEGYKEITLLGQNVNSYQGGDGADFADLIERIAQIPGKFRLRFMTNHPKDLSEKLVKVMAKYPTICRCIHLPVQAGSNRILQLMNRRYTREDYLAKVELIRSTIPDCAITSDVMVGFPTETEEDFLQTMDLVKRANYSGAFTFVYSPRKGTKAAVMEGQVSAADKKSRIVRLVELQNAVTRAQSEGYVGKSVEVLCEDYDAEKNLYLGRDEFGRMVHFTSEKDVFGEFCTVKITKAGGMSLIGEIQ